MLEKHSIVYEELRLSVAVLQKLQGDLEASNALLPYPARMLQEWNVGLLDRFECTH